MGGWEGREGAAPSPRCYDGLYMAALPLCRRGAVREEEAGSWQHGGHQRVSLYMLQAVKGQARGPAELAGERADKEEEARGQATSPEI